MGIWDLFGSFGGSQGPSSDAGFPASYPAPGTPLANSYPVPGTPQQSWRTNAYGTSPGPGGPGMMANIGSGVGAAGTGILKGIAMLIGQLGGLGSGGGAPIPYTGPNNLFGANAPGGATTPMATAAAAPATANVGYTGLGVSNYGQLAKGIPSFARTNQANILSRNLL